MNPLDLRGPEFLTFYLAFGIAVLVAARFLKHRLAGAPPEGARLAPGVYPNETDASAIALLRGGPLEAARTLLGRLVASGSVVVERGALAQVIPSAERLAWFEERATATLAPGMTVAAAEEAIQRAAAPDLTRIEEDLERQGLLTSKESRGAIWRLVLGALAVLPGLGLVKLWVALDRGHTNVGYLILLMILYTILVFAMLAPRRVSQAGRRYLQWLRGSHQAMVSALKEGRRAPVAGELALAAGIFGLTMISVPAFAELNADLRQRMPGNSGSDGGGSSDSGSSDSGSSDGGGGDGGGGCGGGGCGGCGS
jgi:uncharacterized protein (TIGR04222 family)